MSKWRKWAPEIQEWLNAGATKSDIAAKLHVSEKTIENRLPEMERQGWIKRPQKNTVSKPPLEVPQDAKESIELTKDGTYNSEKPLWMTFENVTDTNYLLKAHGFNPDAWELVTARNNRWNAYSKQDGIMVLYASKITVKPKQQSWTFDDLLSAVTSVPAIHIPESSPTCSSNRMLEIPLYDTHFGISDIDHYRDTQSDTLDHIRSKVWEQIEITIGQDLLHNDNFRGTTASGTPIEAVDMPAAWSDALRFYAPIIAIAKKQARSVKIIYSKGNHDESMSWAFVQNLRSLFPWAKFDHAVEERKVHMFHRCFIGITHGDKTPPKELVTLFATEFPEQWAQAITREIHKGHWHKEDANDDYGSMVRTLATRNKTDLWHKNRGFTRPHKRFQLFEWDHNELKHIHYV